MAVPFKVAEKKKKCVEIVYHGAGNVMGKNEKNLVKTVLCMHVLLCMFMSRKNQRNDEWYM